MSDSGTARYDEVSLTVPKNLDMSMVLGANDVNLKVIEDSFENLRIYVRGHEIKVRGQAQDVTLVAELLNELINLLGSGVALSADLVARSLQLLRSPEPISPTELLSVDILQAKGKTIRAKTIGQRAYVSAIAGNLVTFGIGPAGTGKTYLAMAMAVQALQSRAVRRIVLTRPAVEAGEKLGFLPGGLTEKIDPYLRPLYDALYDMIEPDSISRLLESGTIEVAPLAFMRGRTLNDSFVILDEAQNTSQEQMRMFLTRLGFNSKMVVTGDVTQIDLPRHVASGLKTIDQVLQGIDGIEFCYLESKDVVRHQIVGQIIDAYARAELPERE